ncbi:hypothetical protein P6P35_16195, partial [Clostridium perfringens]|nr:hypothetical protein [Clostridium perfringens]
VQYPNRAKSIGEIQEDFQLANKSDLETILQLKETGQPDIWYKIFLANERIKSRQDLVKTLPGATVQKLGLTFVDNTRDMEEARNRATLYSYAR